MKPARECRSAVSWGVVVVIVVVLCWLLSILGPLSLLIVPIFGFAWIRAALCKAWVPLVVMVCANPFVVFFVHGFVDYSEGAPRLLSMGLPRMEFYNVDRETRCFRQTGGCVSHSNEWVFQMPHNLALRVAAEIFGPPARSYDGPYPSKEEALGLVASGSALDISLLRKGEVRVGKQMIQLDPEMVRELGFTFMMMPIADSEPADDDEGFHAQAVLYQDRCLILRFADRGIGSDDETDCLVLIDTRARRPFAYYPIKGRGFPHSPRVQYLPEDSR